MKNSKSFLISLLLLNVLLLTSAANAFAHSTQVLDLGSREGDFFKARQNQKAVFWEENISAANFQTSSELENEFLEFSFNLHVETSFSGVDTKNQLTSKFRPDHRRILTIQLFPFHSFW